MDPKPETETEPASIPVEPDDTAAERELHDDINSGQQIVVFSDGLQWVNDSDL